MRNKQRIILAAIAAIVLATGGLAGGDTAITPSAQSLTLEQARDLALQNNSQIAVQDLEVSSAQIDLEAAKKAQKQAEDLPDKYKNQDVYQVLEFIPLQAGEAYEFALVKKQYVKNSIAYGLESAYYGALAAEKLQDANEASLKRAEEQRKAAQSKYQVGTAAKVDVLAAETAVKAAEAALAEAKDTVAAAKMALNQLLHQSLDTPLLLTSQFAFQEAAAVDLSTAIAQAQGKDVTVRAAKMAAAIADKYFDYQKKFFTSNVTSYRKAEIDAKNGKIAYEDALVSCELNVRRAYMNLATAKENYYAYRTSLELAKEVYRLTELRYQAGMATVYELMDAEATVKQAELGQLSALQGYFLANAKFVYGIYSSTGSTAGSGNMQ